MNNLIVLFATVTMLAGCAQTTPEMNEKYCLASSDFKSKQRVYESCMNQIKQSKKSENKTAENIIQALIDVIIDQ